MPLFAPKSTNLIGLELGASAVKAVELRHTGGKFELVTYGSGVHDQTNIRKSVRANTEHIIQTVRAVLEQSQMTTDRVVVSLPAMNVFHTTLEVPAMAQKDLASAIRWEAKRLLPLPVEKMSLDWHPLPTPGKNKSIRVILTAAPHDVVEQYVNIVKQAGLSLVGVETEVNALQRSLLPGTTSTSLVIDIGASNTNSVIFTNGAPVIVRNINVGSTAISNQIASALNITPERAADIRADIGLAFDTAVNHPAVEAIKFVVDTLIIKEIRRVIAANKEPIDHIILAGGAAHLKGAAAYFQRQLSRPTTIGNPWQHIQSDPRLADTLTAIGPEMAVAVGLAMKTKKPGTR